VPFDKVIKITFNVLTFEISGLRFNFGEVIRIRVRTTKIRTLKVRKNIKNISKHQNVKNLTKHQNVKNLSKHQNNDNYLWCITYGYQGLWGVRLESVRLG
jgi:hypothetical protein